MQQEPMIENESDFLLTPEQESAMLSEYGASDDTQENLQDADQPDSIRGANEQKQDIKSNSGLTNAFHNHYVGYMDLFGDQQT
ncbi:MAG: hypothetical protein ACOYN8_13765, partial [Pseudanabaena sp.]